MDKFSSIKSVQLTESGYLLNGSMSVPNDPRNRHCALILEWITEGNIPDPIPEPTIEQIKATLEAAIDKHIDQIAKYKRYGRAGISPSVACLGYAAYLNPYQAEAIAYGQWIASIWPVVNQIMADVESGLRPIPTEQELISELPEMIWPELGE
jgi:hypothetical protein